MIDRSAPGWLRGWRPSEWRSYRTKIIRGQLVLE